MTAPPENERAPVQSDIRCEADAEQAIEGDVGVRVPHGSVGPRVLNRLTGQHRGGVMPDEHQPIHDGRDHRREYEQDDDTEDNLDGSRQSVQLLPVVAAVVTVETWWG